MQRLILIVCFLIQGALVMGQALRDINYSYLYNPVDVFSLNWKILNLNNQLSIYYELSTQSENQNLDAYEVQWEIRGSLSDKQGKPVQNAEIILESPKVKSGRIYLDPSAVGQIAVAKIYGSLANNQKTLTLFTKPIPATPSPVLFQEQFPVLNTYTRQNKTVSIRGFEPDQELLISHYTDEFPAAAPPFSLAQARVPVTLKPDTAFTTPVNNPLTFTEKGLYLVQSDTSSSEGLAFRIEDDYPRLNKLESLTGPMIYICTKQEYDRLKSAGNDKPQFDKVILSITGNTDRARTFMRNYFRRVEQANTYFSSYKEGWKTDRGMMFIIYGPPQEVYLLGDREVWEYNNTYYKGRFTFIKSSTLFDPENYVLIRDKKFMDAWYQLIDLWRKARF